MKLSGKMTLLIHRKWMGCHVDMPDCRFHKPCLNGIGLNQERIFDKQWLHFNQNGNETNLEISIDRP
jgi:hypothetical protein